ncbi:MAG: valine--tRNA ligase [Planctomycetota bacterium]
MSQELSKTYDPNAVEKAAYERELAAGAFHADPSVEAPAYTIVIPPPNVTGSLHMGHALDNTLQDVLIRWRRMEGRNTLWMPGVDHAGIATQTRVEKKLLEETGKNRYEIGREKLVAAIWEWKAEYGDRILEQLKGLAASCDWDRTRFTLDDMCARAVRQIFFDLFRDGHIYRGKRLVNWDPATQTALADDEVEHKETQSKFYHLRYPLTSGEGHVVVATTRPETMLGDTAVAVHPDDERYQKLIGQTVTLPLMNREIPIIADHWADPTKGSGCVKITPARDPNDYEVGLRHDLPMINVMHPDARINENGGAYEGLDRYAARKKIIQDLEAQGLVERIEEITNEIGHSYRSNAAIEPYLSDQWFVAVKSLAAPAIEAAKDGRLKFHPERYQRTYLDWLENLRDWCISRQLWWGHRIPIWHADGGDEADFEKAFSGDPQTTWRRTENGQGWLVCSMKDLAGDEVKGVTLERDPDVLDTWFSSALWPFSTLGWPESTPELKRYYPTNTLVTARDIITLWVSRMVMFGLYGLGELPFTDVFIHATILDGEGQRMSKSLGNGVDPLDIIATYGSDAMRFTLAHMTTDTQDIRLPVERDAEGRNTSKRFEIGRNFCNKLWNASRFAFMNLEGATRKPLDPKALPVEDRWILSRLQKRIAETQSALEAFTFHPAIDGLREFFWNELCDWYLEIIKPRVKEGGESGQAALQVLATCLDRSLRLFHPFIPLITETLWWKLNEVVPERGLPGHDELDSPELLVNAPWPKMRETLRDETAEKSVEQMIAITRAVREVRSEHKVGPKDTIPLEIAAASLPGLDEAGHIVREMAGVSEITCTQGGGASSDAATFHLEGVEYRVKGVVDQEAEKQRLEKQLEKLRGEKKALEGRLSNAGYVDRAPAHLVQESRDRLAQVETEIDGLAARLKG